jgi:hypothetical protein
MANSANFSRIGMGNFYTKNRRSANEELKQVSAIPSLVEPEVGHVAILQDEWPHLQPHFVWRAWPALRRPPR